MAPKRKRQEAEELGSEEEEEAEEVISSGEDQASDGEEEEEEEILEPKILPNRTTRGGRMKMMEDQDSADEDFWNQEFFAEEGKEPEYSQSEPEEEDVPDSDFSDSEDDDDEDEEENEAKMRRDERRKQKTLKPPGGTKKPPGLKIPKKPTQRKDFSKVVSPKTPISPNTRAAIKAVQESEDLLPRSFRESTKQKVEEAEKERDRAEQEKRLIVKKKPSQPQYKPLTQEELLAEAAQNEIENLRSLEIMQALEEEVKKKAAVKRARFSGPYIRYLSKKVNNEALLTCEVANMLPPPEMQRQKAPPAKKQVLCAVTGKPAKYFDPVTNRAYSDISAFKILRQMYASQFAHTQIGQVAGNGRYGSY